MTTLLIIAFLAAALVAFVFFMQRQKIERTPAEVAHILERFLDGGISYDEWDDFVSVGIRDPELDAIALRCRLLPDEFPTEDPAQYASAEGLAVVQEYIRTLRLRGSEGRKGPA